MRTPDSPRPVDDATRPTAQSLLLDEAPAAAPANWRQVFPNIVGRSAAMASVLATVSKIARSDGSVLILGESGTGKELIAHAIHRLSHRAAAAFVPINCSAIPETLLESELFGHEKGSFTSADRKKIGKFQYAHGGTIFLDEIGDMKPGPQVKLLRVLQEKKFAMIGSNELIDADVRIIAATNADLERAIRDKIFREDLYYRLNVLPIHLPALRERSEDIPDLLEHFVEVQNRLHGVQRPCYFSAEATARLTRYRWPGNVRQLENAVSRLVILKGGGEIGVGDLPPELLTLSDEPRESRAGFRAEAALPLPRPIDLAAGPRVQGVGVPADFGRLPETGMDLPSFIENLENDLIRQALERTGNNRNQAAKLLGLNRTTLVERIKKRQLSPLNEPSKEL
jgi:DNA-binding NtrC family response regulator